MLPSPDLEGKRTCLSCGTTTTEKPTTAERPSPTPSPQPTPSAPPAWSGAAGGTGGAVPPPGGDDRFTVTQAPATRRRGCGCLVPILILFLIGGIGLAAFDTDWLEEIERQLDGVGGGSGLTLSSDEALALPRPDGGPPDLVTVGHRYESATSSVVWSVVRLDADGDTGDPRWMSPLPDGVSDTPLVRAGDLAVFAAGPEVRAVSLADGTPRWSATLSDDVDPYCDGCLFTAGDSVMVLAKDHHLAALDPADGSLRWEWRFEDTGGWAVPAGDSVLVIDRAAETGATAIARLAALDGAPLAGYEPACPRPDATPQPLGFDTLVVGLADGSAIVAYGTVAACVERRAPDGAMAWQVPVEGSGFGRRARHAIGDTWFAVTDRNDTLITVGVETGERAELPSEADQTLVPIDSSGPLVLAVAETTRGTTQSRLIAVDPGALAALVNIDMGRATSGLPPDNITGIVSDNERLFVAALEGGRVAAVTIDGEDGTLELLVVDPADPADPHASIVAGRSTIGVLTFAALVWDEEWVVIRRGAEAVAIPLAGPGEPVRY
ncbi:MAG: PQQ-binding-like beta-propeller repeat protein [Acidimicrobiia bacterium]|nr:PQQ-binding-like beta-propeller repeat protein [Acidimicrobiia bacterium]